MDTQYPTDSGNDTTPPLPDWGPRDGSYEEAKNASNSSSLEDPPEDGTTIDSSDESVDGADDAGGSKPSGQTGHYSDAGTDAVDETVPVQD